MVSVSLELLKSANAIDYRRVDGKKKEWMCKDWGGWGYDGGSERKRNN